MATQNIIPIEVVRTISGNSPWLLQYPEFSGQTWMTGAILTMNATGYIVEATSPNPLRILGVAAEPGHNYAATDAINNLCRVWLADDDTIFRGSLTTGQTSTLLTPGFAFGLVKTGNFWCLDNSLTSATHANFRAIGIINDPRNAVGDVQASIQFMFNQNTTMMLYTS
jgi:hypothetical protein